jgi:hypothetical protein
VLGNGRGIQKISEITIMKTIIENGKDVAEPDQIASGMAGTGLKNITHFGKHGNLLFYLYDRQDRISDRLNKKIGRLEQRITGLEERGRC